MPSTSPTGAAEPGEPAQADPHQDDLPPADPTEELRARVTELEGRWRTALADLDNHRKRTAREAEAALARERARVAAAWLPVLDNLDAALTHATADPATIVAGVRAVRDQAAGVLAGLGFPRRDEQPGTPFDPALHEAVHTLAAPEHEPGTIVQVVRSGYGTDDHVLRPAAVVVATKAP